MPFFASRLTPFTPSIRSINELKLHAFCKTNFKASISVRTNSNKKTTYDIIIPLLFCSYQNVNIFSNLITFILPKWRISCIFSNVQLHHVLLLWFHLLFARKGKKSSSAISFISNEFCCCFTKDSVKHVKRVWDILSLYIYILYIVIVFLVKPNNLELILRHPASLLKNTVPRKSRVAPFYHRYKGVYEIQREVTFWNTSYSPVLIKLPHFSCSCRNEGQRLDAFQIYYLLACENIRFSLLFAAGDVSWGGTSATQRQKFHTDDAKSVRNLVRSADWSTE